MIFNEFLYFGTRFLWDTLYELVSYHLFCGNAFMLCALKPCSLMPCTLTCAFKLCADVVRAYVMRAYIVYVCAVAFSRTHFCRAGLCPAVIIRYKLIAAYDYCHLCGDWFASAVSISFRTAVRSSYVAWQTE